MPKRWYRTAVHEAMLFDQLKHHGFLSCANLKAKVATWFKAIEGLRYDHPVSRQAISTAIQSQGRIKPGNFR
jgi:hypothetical protein